MIILAMSDLHGHCLDVSQMLHADVAVIAGDITPATQKYHGTHASGRYQQSQWILHTFIPWLDTVPVRQVVMTWGNHDHIGEYPDLLPASVWPSHMHMLVNQRVTIDGVSFYGVPQTPRFRDWAFNEDDLPADHGRRWAQVPMGTDVLVSHGPPRGVCDTVAPPRRGVFSAGFGSRTQAEWLRSDTPNRPRMVICGHIHGSGGRSGSCGETLVYNVAVVNEEYALAHPPRVLVLPHAQ